MLLFADLTFNQSSKFSIKQFMYVNHLMLTITWCLWSQMESWKVYKRIYNVWDVWVNWLWILCGLIICKMGRGASTFYKLFILILLILKSSHLLLLKIKSVCLTTVIVDSVTILVCHGRNEEWYLSWTRYPWKLILSLLSVYVNKETEHVAVILQLLINVHDESKPCSWRWIRLFRYILWCPETGIRWSR